MRVTVGVVNGSVVGFAPIDGAAPEYFGAVGHHFDFQAINADVPDIVARRLSVLDTEDSYYLDGEEAFHAVEEYLA